MIGTTLGHYRIVRQLGSGGMGEVYAAEDQKLHRLVALKVLSTPIGSDDERRERFQREAQAVAALNHPNIVTIYSVELSGSTHFLTMEMVEGRPLSVLIPADGLPLDRVLKLAIPLAHAVSAAHHRGIMHRDLKPENVMVGDDGRLKVLDFGLAKLKEAQYSPSSATMLATQTLTGEGRIIGTVAYMSPEQAEGRPVDHRSDIFSLGIVLYEMVTGQRPFKGDTSISVLSSILKDTPRSVNDVDVSRDGQWIVLSSSVSQEDLFVARADGTGLRQLTNDPANDRFPRWSPDGKRIAFYSNRAGSWEIWTINADGSGLSQLTRDTGAHYPIWSPEGSRMVFSEIVERRGVSIVDLAQPRQGQTPKQLPNPAAGPWRATSWSSDGRLLAGVETSGDQAIRLVVYSLDSGSFKILSDARQDPYWLPDTRRMIFTKALGVRSVADWQTGAIRDVLSRPMETFFLGSVSSDGRMLYLLRRSHEADIWMATLN